MKNYSLCTGGTRPDECPVVSISPSLVTIGENKNTVKLKKTEWNKLVELIREGKLKKIRA